MPLPLCAPHLLRAGLCVLPAQPLHHAHASVLANGVQAAGAPASACHHTHAHAHSGTKADDNKRSPRRVASRTGTRYYASRGAGAHLEGWGGLCVL
jgi:hypothetical protein